MTRPILFRLTICSMLFPLVLGEAVLSGSAAPAVAHSGGSRGSAAAVGVKRPATDDSTARVSALPASPVSLLHRKTDENRVPRGIGCDARWDCPGSCPEGAGSTTPASLRAERFVSPPLLHLRI